MADTLKPATTHGSIATLGARIASAAALALLTTSCKCNDDTQGATSAKATPAAAGAAVMTAGDKACCMGLNECKGKGGCAVPESHACAGQNECKGKGGCNMHCPK